MSKLRIVVSSALAGLALSVVAGFTHADRIAIAGIKIPFGLPLALLICLLSVLWLNRLFGTRLAGVVFVVIWVITTLQLAVESPKGDLILSATWYSTAYVVAGAILLSATAVVPPMRKRESAGVQIQGLVPDRLES